MTNSWYIKWFDTEYYHILYQDRDYQEASLFIDNITAYLNLPEEAKILDLCCGKGRHSIYLNRLGYDVWGVDLSENSIKSAQKFQNDKLHFEVHDMRKPLNKTFDVVMNLFTSFGYFDTEQEHLQALKSIKDSLNEFGFAVMDFMNVRKVIPNLVSEETKHLEGIDFHIQRKAEDGYIYKDIRFTDKEQDFHFTEKVKALSLEDFEHLMEQTGIYLLDVFGDYKLGKFYPETSDRLIMIFK